MFLPEKGYKRLLIIFIYAFLLILGAYLFFKYLFACILPFAVAFLIAGSTRKCVLYLNSKLKLSRFFSVLITTLGILAILLLIIYLFFQSVFSELSGLTVYLTQNSISNTFNEISTSLYGVLSKYLPFLFENLKTSFFEVSDSISQLIAGITNGLLPVVANTVLAIIKTFPKILLFTGVTLLSLFYFGYDYEKITGFISAQLTEKQRKIVLELKNQFFLTIFSTVRAYMILILITFCELLTGFLIIGIPYATILALLISIIDILPVLGTGTVLIPWSVIMFLNKNSVTGLSILALYVIITIVRQIAEPKILGGSLGLHPLITLISMYFGVKLVGISGLFTFPLIVIILKNLNDKQCIHLYNSPVLTEAEKGKLTKSKFKSFKQSDFKE